MSDETTTAAGETPAQAETVQDTAQAVETWEDGKPFDPATAKALIEKLRAENKQLKPAAKKAQDYEAKLRAQEDADKSEIQRMKERLEQAEKELQGTKRRETQRKIAAKFGLPDALADRLHGDTEDEMEADAKELLEAMPKRQAAPVNNPSSVQTAAETDAQRRARIYGSAGLQSLYDPTTARQMGGGVINNQK